MSLITCCNDYYSYIFKALIDKYKTFGLAHERTDLFIYLFCSIGDSNSCILTHILMLESAKPPTGDNNSKLS